jgi:hypothetical protein
MLAAKRANHPVLCRQVLRSRGSSVGYSRDELHYNLSDGPTKALAALEETSSSGRSAREHCTGRPGASSTSSGRVDRKIRGAPDGAPRSWMCPGPLRQCTFGSADGTLIEITILSGLVDGKVRNCSDTHGGSRVVPSAVLKQGRSTDPVVAEGSVA